MKYAAILLCLFVTQVFADPFWDKFGDGKAEISSYKVVQPRYGENRNATSVMIFVPEHLHRKTKIKIEDYKASSPSDQVQVLKLNRTLEFTTGIYNYNVMTSVFAEMEAGFFPMKISLSSSEWCGNFYEHLLPEKIGAKRVRHSYFEKEGDKDDFLKAPSGGIYEDALPIMIRELKGEWMKVGEKRAVKMLATLWSSRITHRDLHWEDATITKVSATEWRWTIGSRTTSYWIDAEYPHYITKWESSDGEKGTRLKTLHMPYWAHNHLVDVKLRKQLKLSE